MKKKLLGLGIGVLFLLSVFFVWWLFCNDEELAGGLEIEGNPIVLVNAYTNWAWGYSNNGLFIDAEGAVYYYSFDQYEPGYDALYFNTPLLDKLEIVRQYGEPIMTIDKELVKTLYQYGMAIDPADTYESKSVACDAGERTLYFYNSEKDKLVDCREIGDWEGELQSKEAQKYIRYFDKEISTAIYEQDKKGLYSNPRTVHYYGKEDLFIKNMHWGYMGRDFVMLIDSKEALEELKEKFDGSDLGILSWWYKEGTPEQIFDSYVFLVQYCSVSSTGYDLKKQGIFIQGDRIFFVEDPESVYPEGEVGCAMDGFCFVGAIPRECIEDIAGVKSAMEAAFN